MNRNVWLKDTRHMKNEYSCYPMVAIGQPGGWQNVVIVALMALSLLFSSTIGYATTTNDDVAPADVLVAVQYINQELERLRLYMGRPKVNTLDIRVSNAAPHNVYFQALSLFQKANRLSFEVIRQRQTQPETPKGIPRPQDALLLVKAAHQAMDNVQVEFKVVDEHPPIKRIFAATPTDVFQTIQATNQQINLLLNHRFGPSDAYMAVTEAMGYITLQLALYPDAKPIPDPPEFVPNKMPGDVFLRLLECADIIQNIFTIANLQALQIHSDHVNKADITPSDVFDLASLIVSRLDFLHKHFHITKTPRETFYPGRQYPAHVYQRAGILLSQLQQLERLMKSHGLPRQGIGR